MSAPNFRLMDYNMPMVCGGYGIKDFGKLKAEYEAEYDEEYTEGMYESDMEFESEEAEQMAENFSNGLKYHKVEIEGGYYYGFQFTVSELYGKQFDLDKSSEYCIDNDDAHYYFDCCRSKAIREADAEKRKIRKWLEETAAKCDFEILVCLGIFSNGEAVYDRRTC